MLFNSSEFFLFLIIVFSLYWLIPREKLKAQHVLLLAASYFFYGWWEWKFLGLIIFSSLVDFLVGLRIGSLTDNRKRKIWLSVSLIINLGILSVFKYYDFFLIEFNELIKGIGFRSTWPELNLVIPLGISFYTFQSLSYSIDCYRRKITPEKDLIKFLTYVSFFPQLVAGPIEKASNLLPQFSKEKEFNYRMAVDGLHQVIWGFFKKVVIADNCAILANQIFNQETYTETSAIILILGVILFAIQIYGDFSGYSDIAIGTAKLFGFKLITNFQTPYFSTSTAELWRRWHISLSEYANEYLFLPLASYYAKYKKKAILFSLFLTFTIIGLWHGANWTYIVFGAWNGVIVSLEYATTKKRRQLSKKIPKPLFNILGWFLTILIWLIGMTFFRSSSIGGAMEYFSSIAFNFGIPFDWNFFQGKDATNILSYVFYFILILFIIEWLNRNEEFGTKFKVSLIQKTVSILVILFIFFYGKYDYQEFIYFQF